MEKTFKEIQYDHQYEVTQNHPEWFDNDGCFGTFRKKTYRFVLKDCMNNLYEPLRTTVRESPLNVLRYFKENGIGWWSGARPSNHLCSSQISCINHLFPLRYDHDAVLSIANGVAAMAEEDPFEDVLEIGGDKVMPGFIAFELVSSKDYLNEANNGVLSRGAQCTSVDAAIVVKRQDKVYILPIEWKFVEEYHRDDKSRNVFSRKENEWHNSGDERIRRYFESGLVPGSEQIMFENGQNPHGTVFFQEPFYQLMRQTLWAEQVIKEKDAFFHGASDYIHVHVVPDANTTLRDKTYRKVDWDNGKGMIATWKENLRHPEKYVCIDPKKLFEGIVGDEVLSARYSDLLKYLETRYW